MPASLLADIMRTNYLFFPCKPREPSEMVPDVGWNYKEIALFVSSEPI